MWVNGVVKWVWGPEMFVVLGLLGVWVFWKRGWVRNGFWVFTGLVVFVVYVLPVPVWLVKSREREFAALIDLKGVLGNERLVHVVVLGAGHTNDPGMTVTGQLSDAVTVRMVEGVRIYKELDSAMFVGSGSPNKGDSRRSQAEAVCDAAVKLGVNVKDTLWLDNTENTEGEARAYAERFGILRDSVRVVLVTNALHMRRAVLWFDKYGIKVVPAPCGFIVKEEPGSFKNWWIPSLNKGRMMDAWMEEVLGEQLIVNN